LPQVGGGEMTDHTLWLPQVRGMRSGGQRRRAGAVDAREDPP
jgi:hypothetical protein